MIKKINDIKVLCENTFMHKIRLCIHFQQVPDLNVCLKRYFLFKHSFVQNCFLIPSIKHQKKM